MKQLKTYCINLDHRIDRWGQASEQFAKHSLSVERFSAIKGGDYIGDSKLKTGLIGCNLSHYFIIERAKVLGFDSVMIFEDDVVLHDNFIQEFHACLPELPTDWNMLYFGGSHREPVQKISDRICKVSKTLTTHAYIIHRSMYDRALEMLRNLSEPVDCLFAELQKEFNVYVTNPPLAWQRESFSDIENRVMNYDWIKTNDQ